MIIGITIAVFGLLIGFVIVNYVRHRQAIFEGTVTDKDVRETQAANSMNQDDQPGTIMLGSNNGNLKHEYIIKIQTDQGKNITWQISQGKYEIVKIGDHVTKVKGTTDVEITSQVAAAPATPQVPPTVPQPPATPPIV